MRARFFLARCWLVLLLLLLCVDGPSGKSYIYIYCTYTVHTDWEINSLFCQCKDAQQRGEEGEGVFFSLFCTFFLLSSVSGAAACHFKGRGFDGRWCAVFQLLITFLSLSLSSELWALSRVSTACVWPCVCGLLLAVTINNALSAPPPAPAREWNGSSYTLMYGTFSYIRRLPLTTFFYSFPSIANYSAHIFFLHLLLLLLLALFQTLRPPSYRANCCLYSAVVWIDPKEERRKKNSRKEEEKLFPAYSLPPTLVANWRRKKKKDNISRASPSSAGGKNLWMCTPTTTTTMAKKKKKKKRTLHKLTCINRTQKHYSLICCCSSPAPNINGEKPVRITQHFPVTSVVLSCRLCGVVSAYTWQSTNQPTNRRSSWINSTLSKQT